MGLEMIKGEYGTSMMTGPEERPDRSQDAERAADQITFSDVLQMFNWNNDDFERAKVFGFPGARGRVVARESWMGLGESYYSRREIAQWGAALKGVAASMRRTNFGRRRLRRHRLAPGLWPCLGRCFGGRRDRLMSGPA